MERRHKQPPGATPKVAILFSLGLEGERLMCRGIIDYARRNGPWRLHLLEGRPGGQRLDLAFERFDGVISAGGDEKANAAIRRIGIPFVLMEPEPALRDSGGASPIPYVAGDNRAIGALAAGYYMDRGYKSFAFVGAARGEYWSEERRAGFAAALARRGFGFADYGTPTAAEATDWSAERPRMEEFLLSLPHGTALFAAMDARALPIANLCPDIGLAVPADIAVLGVDNDPLLCEASSPALSSIRTGGYRRGHTAAAMLDALMQGRPIDGGRIVQEPLDVVARGTTGYGTATDVHVARAIAFIREKTGGEEPVGVAETVRAARCSRRYLERHFRAEIGRTIHGEIALARIERVKSLLENTNLPIGEIAAQSGYSQPGRLATLFRRETGCTMRQWRAASARPPAEEAHKGKDNLRD